MLSNPKVYEQLKQEIRGSFATADDITINTIGGLSYLLAVINETRYVIKAKHGVITNYH